METDQTAIPKLTVKTMSDQAIQVELGSEVKLIGDVKKRLVSKNPDIPPVEKQLLISKGRLLGNEEEIPDSNTTLYLFHYEPAALLADPIEMATEWDTKNRMRVFKGLYLFSRRNFAEAAPLLADALATFSEPTFIQFKSLVTYAAVSAMLVMDRPSILKHIVKSPEVLEVIGDLPSLEKYINSFYNCRYEEFFKALGLIEDDFKQDWLISPHVQYIIKEMRVRAYGQILQSYKSLTMASMARSFGVSVSFIDREISRFIAAGRLNCIIDKVRGIVITNPPDKLNSEYEALIKQGDALVARMQKLGRVASY